MGARWLQHGESSEPELSSGTNLISRVPKLVILEKSEIRNGKSQPKHPEIANMQLTSWKHLYGPKTSKIPGFWSIEVLPRSKWISSMLRPNSSISSNSSISATKGGVRKIHCTIPKQIFDADPNFWFLCKFWCEKLSKIRPEVQNLQQKQLFLHSRRTTTSLSKHRQDFAVLRQTILVPEW